MRFASTPGLFPAFAPRIHDYVVRCDDGPVAVHGSTAAGWEAAVGNAWFRGGHISATVPLSTGQDFAISVRKVGSSNARHYHVRCLPGDFPAWSFRHYGPVSPRFFAVDTEFRSSPTAYAIIFDHHGVPIWWHPAPAWGVRVLPDGDVLWANQFVQPGAWEIHRLDGTLVERLTGVGHGANQHDLQFLDNGDYLIGAYVGSSHVDTSPYGGSSDADVVNAQLQEVSPDGRLLWRWNSQNHISLAETGSYWPEIIRDPTPHGYDIVHWNSVEPDGDSVIASFRHLDAVYKIDKGTGDIVWKLGGTATPQSLRVIGDPHPKPLVGQHDARIMADGTLTVFDNRTNAGDPTPEALRFRIDQPTRTATLLQSVSDPKISASHCCGSARLLPDGDWLIGWGQHNPVGGYTADGQRTFLLRIAHDFSYRAEPVPPGAVTTPDLRRAMRAMYPKP